MNLINHSYNIPFRSAFHSPPLEKLWEEAKFTILFRRLWLASSVTWLSVPGLRGSCEGEVVRLLLIIVGIGDISSKLTNHLNIFSTKYLMIQIFDLSFENSLKRSQILARTIEKFKEPGSGTRTEHSARSDFCRSRRNPEFQRYIASFAEASFLWIFL